LLAAYLGPASTYHSSLLSVIGTQYSNDLARLMLWSLLGSDKTEPIILATDPEDEISIADAARLVMGAMEFIGEIVLDGTRGDGQF
jgi:hypothetical protein